MKKSLSALAVLAALAVIAVVVWRVKTPPLPEPWEGVTLERYEAILNHRTIGLGHLENEKGKEKAVCEFEAITDLQPGLGFGYANEAWARYQTLKVTPSADDLRLLEQALAAAERRLPNSGQLLLIRALYESTQQKDTARAIETLQRAIRVEPEYARSYYQLANLLDRERRDEEARAIRAQLAELLPGNLVVQAKTAIASAEADDLEVARACFERMLRLLGPVRDDIRELVATVAAELENGNAKAAVSPLRMTTNLVVQSLQWRRHHEAIAGNNADPSDLAFREFDPPPPPMPEPEPGDPLAITWEDVTEAAGLNEIRVRVGPISTSGPPLGATPLTDAPFEPEKDNVSLKEAGLPPLTLAIASETRLPLLQLRNGRYEAMIGSPLVTGVAPYFLDLDNSFQLELYDLGPDRRVPREDDGWGGPLPAPAEGAAGPGRLTAADFDLDGDLDLIRTQPLASGSEPSIQYLQNNGDGTFTDRTEDVGLRFDAADTRKVLAFDYDRDLDIDILVVNAAGRTRLYENRRQDLFVEVGEAKGLGVAAGSLDAALADVDRDGWFDLLIAGDGGTGLTLYHNNRGQFEVQSDPILTQLADELEVRWVEFVDYDNDGWQDLLVGGRPQTAAGGLRLFRQTVDGWADVSPDMEDSAGTLGCLPYDYDRDGDHDLLTVLDDGRLRLLRNNGGNKNHWLRLTLHAKTFKNRNDNNSQANNSFGVGAEVEIIATRDYQKLLMTGPARLIGLGRHEAATVARINWNHGVFDNHDWLRDRLGLQGEMMHYEVQIPRGSCPMLFAWNGSRYEMVTDCNWRSPLGMLFARGAPVPHDQTRDFVKVDGDLLQEDSGLYRLIITEELREVNYIDWAQLAVIDHPTDVEFYVDERLRMGPPMPFELYTVRHPRPPVAAVDGQGNDLLADIVRRDQRYTNAVPRSKYRGLAPRHDLILDLGPMPDPRHVRLFLRGWYYPGGTSVNIAASQDSSMPVGPTTLAVADGRGGWKTVDPNVGMPAGRDKTMVLNLPGGFPSSDHRVKLTTSFELRWDVAFYTSGETVAAPTRMRKLTPVRSTLSRQGYSKLYRRGVNGPFWYDFETPEPDRSYHPIPGRYTRFGDVTELLQQVDDRYVITGPGEAIELVFDGRHLPPLPDGWKRQFVFLTDGWTKDTDPNTVTSQGVGPLPFHGMKRYPYGPEERRPNTEAVRRWQKEYNTRTVGAATRTLTPPQ